MNRIKIIAGDIEPGIVYYISSGTLRDIPIESMVILSQDKIKNTRSAVFGSFVGIILIAFAFATLSWNPDNNIPLTETGLFEFSVYISVIILCFLFVWLCSAIGFLIFGNERIVVFTATLTSGEKSVGSTTLEIFIKIQSDIIYKTTPKETTQEKV